MTGYSLSKNPRCSSQHAALGDPSHLAVINCLSVRAIAFLPLILTYFVLPFKASVLEPFLPTFKSTQYPGYCVCLLRYNLKASETVSYLALKVWSWIQRASVHRRGVLEKQR